MGLPRSLDEYTEQELKKELTARKRFQKQGVCDYCERDPSTPACKFPERHKAKKK